MPPKAPRTNLPHEIEMQDSHVPQSPQIAKWIERAVIELDEVRKHFKPDHVHDLRIALRRCRSVAMGLEQLDPSDAWPRLKKASKRLLGGFGDLRDIQVMRDWIKNLGMEKTEAGIRLCAALDDREPAATRRAHKELDNADRKQWRKWAGQLPRRAERVPCGGPAAELLVLERWREAWELHRATVRMRSSVSYHRLRVGVKRFRDSVESFLPGRHSRWGKELKKLQDLLGEVHDLDVLWSAITRLRPILEKAERAKWAGVIKAERGKRLAAYRAKTKGPKSCWNVWRAALPDGEALERARIDWLAVWASYLDPDPAHSKHVALLATELFDGVLSSSVTVLLPLRARDLLEAAAILHDVGRSEGDHHHQKTSYKLIRERTPPPGWTPSQMETVARIARYHRGGLSKLQETGSGGIHSGHHEGVLFMAGILRLATALANREAAPGEVSVSSVTVTEKEGAIVIRAAGYNGEEPLASKLAAARHLLESVLHHAIVIEPAGSLRDAEIAATA
jgi:CHAD domain-containing protein